MKSLISTTPHLGCVFNRWRVWCPPLCRRGGLRPAMAALGPTCPFSPKNQKHLKPEDVSANSTVLLAWKKPTYVEVEKQDSWNGTTMKFIGLAKTELLGYKDYTPALHCLRIFIRTYLGFTPSNIPVLIKYGQMRVVWMFWCPCACQPK